MLEEIEKSQLSTGVFSDQLWMRFKGKARQTPLKSLRVRNIKAYLQHIAFNEKNKWINDTNTAEYLLFRLALQYIPGTPFPYALHIDSY